MSLYKFPDWLTEKENIKSGHEQTSRTLQEIAEEVERLDIENHKIYREAKRERDYAMATVKAIFGKHPKIKDVPQPPNLKRALLRYTAKVAAFRAHEEKNRKSRVSRRLRQIKDYDWPAEPLTK